MAACEVACIMAATLGIFHRLEVVDLDLFFSFLSFFVFLHVFRFLLLGYLFLLYQLCQ